MKLYQYDDIKKLNQALSSFAKNEIQVNKVDLSTIEGKIHYFVLAEPVGNKPEVENKTKKAKKATKETKEIKEPKETKEIKEPKEDKEAK